MCTANTCSYGNVSTGLPLLGGGEHIQGWGFAEQFMHFGQKTPLFLACNVAWKNLFYVLNMIINQCHLFFQGPRLANLPLSSIIPGIREEPVFS